MISIGQIMDGSSAVTMEKTTVEGYDVYDGQTPYDGNTLRYVKVTEGASGAGQSQVVVTTWYNAQNQPVARVEDPGGEALETTYYYDNQGRLTEVENALLDRTTYKYDEWGNLVGTTVDPDTLYIETLYVYDNFGRLIRTDSPDANSTIYVYNADGTLSRKREGCVSDGSTCIQTTYYEYDGLGRLVRTDYNQTDNWWEEFYVYDGELTFTPWVLSGSTPVYEDWDATLKGGDNGAGRLTASLVRSLSDGDTQVLVATDYSYDPEGRVEGKHYQALVHEKNDANYDEESYKPARYDYDGNGGLTWMKYPSGREVFYCYDDDDPGRPYAVRTSDGAALDDCSDGDALVTEALYYPFGDLSKLTLANGQVQEFTRDKRYALKTLKDGTSGDDDAYHSIAYTYDDFGNITGIDDVSQAVGQYADHPALRYDELHQLAGATLSIHNGATDPEVIHETFSYNSAGNRTQRVGEATDTYTYTANSNKLTAVDDTYDYDFTTNDLGAIVSTQVAAGATITVDLDYTPSGLLARYEDTWVYGGTVIAGTTIEYRFTPSAEMVGFGNLSTEEYWGYGYDPNGNMLVEAMHTESESSDPIIEHIYLGNRLIASVTGSGDACFIATVAYGTPLASDLDVFRAFRDRALKNNVLGREIIGWYYQRGPAGAKWLEGHGLARGAVYVGLVALAVPLKAVLFGKTVTWILIFLCVLCAFVVVRRKGRSYRTALICAGALAIILTIVYSYFMDVPEAKASYTEGAKYYYTIDHIGRPLNLRDDDRDLRWYEQHYPFGNIINEDTPNSDITAGAGDYTVSWHPRFRFPGQFEDISQSALLHNHYREYMPELGRYNRVDPLLFINARASLNMYILPYQYVRHNPILRIDFVGLTDDELVCPPGYIEVNDGVLHYCEARSFFPISDPLLFPAPPNNNSSCKIDLDCYDRCVSFGESMHYTGIMADIAAIGFAVLDRAYPDPSDIAFISSITTATLGLGLNVGSVVVDGERCSRLCQECTCP